MNENNISCEKRQANIKKKLSLKQRYPSYAVFQRLSCTHASLHKAKTPSPKAPWLSEKAHCGYTAAHAY
jgi:hypothetical protein